MFTVFGENDPCDVMCMGVSVFVAAVRSPLTYYSLITIVIDLNSKWEFNFYRKTSIVFLICKRDSK